MSKKNLVIVESPAKAKTIQKYLGADFRVMSSIGHIRSIAKKNGIDTAKDFAAVYEIDPDKKKTVAELRKAVKEAETVWLATDEDREGEAIAWHLCEVLKLDPAKTNRIVFHEITKSAIENAVKNPRHIDMDLVRAQQARQILDRLVGFELSPVVWQKVPGGKSAGRVQSPAVRLLVEREREIQNFESAFTFKITATFSLNDAEIKAELPQKFKTEAEAKAFLESLENAHFTVTDITTSPSTRNPGAPFTTSTLQQEANARLGFGARATMAAAQKLYQSGKITYMRTDSVNLSGQALAQMTEYITANYGANYHQVRNFKTKSASAQEAHEAIRPTDVRVEQASDDPYDQKLYDLIRRRTLASQMTPAKIEKTVARIAISTRDETFEAKGEVVVFDGFLKVYGRSQKDETLPSMKSGDILTCQNATARQTFVRPPARYTEGSLVKKLEDLGIGRPSTYATIISTIQARGYAEKGESEGTPRDVIELSCSPTSENGKDFVSRKIVQEKTGSDKGKLVPTAAGTVVSDFLTGHFDQVIDYDFTAAVETELDEIAANKLDRNKMLHEFYTPFHKLIENSGQIDRASVAQARELGKDPKTNEPVFARFGRYGPMLQMGSNDDKDKKPRFANMPAGKRIETVTLDEALEMFKLPRIVGKTDDGQEIVANIGRFGPYIKIGSLFVSIKPLDPFEIDEEKARELYAAKLQSEAEKNIADFGDGIKVLNGRFGPYITNGKKNAKIPKDIEPKSITHEQAKEMIANAPEPKGRSRKIVSKKTAKRKTSAKKK